MWRCLGFAVTTVFTSWIRLAAGSRSRLSSDSGGIRVFRSRSWRIWREISARRLARRKEAGRLEPDESDRLMRASRVIARAIELFEGDREAARTWLTTHLRALGDHTPLEFAKTDVGAIEVENLIGRLEHGIPT